ncbi:MAG: WD40/YVTN/BNR-like repeat-containing protein [Gemmataceae bacterium]
MDWKIAGFVVWATLSVTARGQWMAQNLGSEASLRGLSVVNGRMAWVSGTGGTVGRTTDGGATWQSRVVPGAEKLDFRDVEAFGERVAYLLAAGPGEASRIYKTVDGGVTWRQQVVNREARGFWDAMAFWDERNGLVFGDPVDGRFQILTTGDGGETWRPVEMGGMPRALPKEGAFAASGTCLVTRGTREAWFVTGGAGKGRVFHSADRGQTWTVKETPVAAGNESSGIFSIAMVEGGEGVVVGGDYRRPNAAEANVARTRDGGRSWSAAGKEPPFCSAVAWAKDRWIAVGTAGAHESLDGGATWRQVDTGNHNAVRFAEDGTGWAVGPKGSVTRYSR